MKVTHLERVPLYVVMTMPPVDKPEMQGNPTKPPYMRDTSKKT